PRYRREILHRIVGDVLEQERIGRMRAVGAHQQRVAVARRLSHIGGRDAAIGALAIVDDDVLVESDTERLRDDAGDNVGTAAGAERHDDCDRPARIGLGGYGGVWEAAEPDRKYASHQVPK